MNRPDPGPARRQQLVCRRRALRLATELCDRSPQQWLARSAGADAATTRLDDDPALGDVLARARALARSRPDTALVHSQAGVGGLVVAAHGPTWSLVARSGGPILVICAAHPDGVRIDTDSDREGELAATVAELITASRARPTP